MPLFNKSDRGKKVIVHIGAEVVPYSKAGGLGDVVGILPQKITEIASDYRCIIITPYYRNISKKINYLGKYEIPYSNVQYSYELYSDEKGGVEYFFIKMDDAFSVDNIYVDGSKPYLVDVGLEYFFFAKCIINLIDRMDINPDAWITHDWHAAGIYCYIGGCHSLHIIHNYHHQGQLYNDIIQYLDPDVQKIAEEIYEESGYLSMNSFAIKMAERIVTVSPSYADELKCKKIAHPGLELFELYNKDICGILNGVDYNKWNPSYDIGNFLEAKSEIKRHIKKEIGINTADSRPILLMMSRLTHQKGIDMFVNLYNRPPFDIFERLGRIINTGCDFVICGVPAGGYSGEIDTQLKQLMERYHENFAYINYYNDDMAADLLSGADILLHISNYEPCGLTPMYAMRYGVVPLVSNTGGLSDIVRTGGFNGFAIDDLSFDNIIKEIKHIRSIYDDREKFAELQKRCIREEFTWDKSAKQYCDIIESLLENEKNISVSC